MGRRTMCGAAIALMAAFLVVGAAKAQEWQSLTDDVSRGELFEQEVRPAAEPAPSGPQSFALNGPFTLPQNARFDAGAPRTNAIFGIDISHHTSPDPRCNSAADFHHEIDFSSLQQQEVRFVFVKATQGVGYRDCRFVEYWNALGNLPSQNRVLRGAYHFLSSSADAALQAQSYIRLMTENGGFSAADMPPALDLEWDKASLNAPDRWATHTPEEIVASALTWLKAVEHASGRRPILYTSRVWWQERHIPESMFSAFSDYSLWVADYSQTRRAVENPATPGHSRWALWQFADNARLTQGYSHGLDVSIFKGTEADFRNQMQLQH